MKPIGVQRKRTKGWKMPPNTVYVGRPTKWGNHLKVGDTVDGIVLKTAGMVVEAHMRWLDANSRVVLAAQFELRGKNLAYWCPVGEPCHRDNLLKVANL